jgi:hypothetical protein
VVHADLRADEGVDIAGDMFDPDVQARLRKLRPQVVLACNIMEHLPRKQREAFAAVIDALLPAGGFLVVTVPYSYPYHADPIDTLYRPSPDQLCSYFQGYEVVEARFIKSESYGDEFLAGGTARMLRRLLRMLFPFVRPKRWLSHAHRMLWLFRQYEITGVVLRKPLILITACLLLDGVPRTEPEVAVACERTGPYVIDDGSPGRRRASCR